MRRLALLPLGLLAILGSGCQSLEDCARETHSKTHSCPIARITVKPRPDLDAYQITFGGSDVPPAEVKADPERLRVWNQEQAKRRADWNKIGDLYEATGCSHDEVYNCNHPAKGPPNTVCVPTGWKPPK